MSERYTEEWVASLLDADRRFGAAGPGELLAGAAPGATVVDYGCGPGYFTLAAARMVGPEGKVYAVDLEPRMVELVRRRAAEAGLANVAAVASDGTRADLPDAVADYIICVQIMHYAEGRGDRVAIARDLSRLLNAGGSVL
ncbi:MAG: class I SAM-dependent methyltransferase, partial [Spirochaetaceae bacterium]|nr:class I SAM-dependent methyltransferase [Spirochaetaceae bacterium]